MSMADSERKRIRRVIRPRELGQMQDIFGHLHHLPFFRVAVADHRHFDLIGRIGNRVQALLCKRKQDDPPRLRHLDTGRDILREKKLLNGNLVRMEGIHQRTDIFIDLAQPEVHRHAGFGFCRAVLHGREFHVVKPYDAVADRAIARVDAKNRHIRKTSVS